MNQPAHTRDIVNVVSVVGAKPSFMGQRKMDVFLGEKATYLM
jgi:hypothetical protein